MNASDFWRRLAGLCRWFHASAPSFFLLPTALIKSVPRARRIMDVICSMMYLMLFVLVDAPSAKVYQFAQRLPEPRRAVFYFISFIT